MNDTTNSLIEQISTRSVPVRRLHSPLQRTRRWLAMALCIAVIVIAALGLRSNLAQAMADPATVVEWVASLLTGILAVYAAFQVSVPGRSSAWAWLPAPAFALWLGGLGWGCIGEVGRWGPAALAFNGRSAECAWTITLVSLPLGLLLLMMVRHAGVVRPGPTAILAALGAAAFSAAVVSLLHEGENALMVLLWHTGAVAVLSLLCLAFSRRLFGWLGHPPR